MLQCKGSKMRGLGGAGGNGASESRGFWGLKKQMN